MQNFGDLGKLIKAKYWARVDLRKAQKEQLNSTMEQKGSENKKAQHQAWKLWTQTACH